MLPFFQSRDERFRTPFGAVTQGTEVFYRICLPRSWRCHGAFFSIQADTTFAPQQFGMFWAGMEGEDREWWDVRHTPAEPGLYWYSFVLETAGGRRFLFPEKDGCAAVGDTPGPSWQLTVYHRDFETPDWLRGGIIYQIFPDRFAKSGVPKADVPADRVLRADWGGQPYFEKDAQGIVRNNDFFGGDLKGIEEKLPHLAALGVTCLYLNPIFEAHSNHRYDTADYRAIDPLLGTLEDFRSLAAAANREGIRLILDGVFSHTGADSRYFNKENRYPQPGAFQSPASPYAPWYRFQQWPHHYTGWWGFSSLPEVDECEPSFNAFINEPDGVVRYWLQQGAAGWRLDVADELPDAFLEALRRSVKEEKPDGWILGEVWEDASNKISYGRRRRYLLGDQLDTVMNYPFREAILAFLTGGASAAFFRQIGGIVENYPPPALHLLMNPLGTHDTPRILTLLAGEPAGGRDRSWQAKQRLALKQRAAGLRRLRLASALQYCLPGVPCLYYGDEAGMEGYADPFNRGCYPWGEEDAGLLQWYRELGRLRRQAAALREGDFRPLPAEEGVVCFVRTAGEAALLCAVNRSAQGQTIALPAVFCDRDVALGGGFIRGNRLFLPSEDSAIAFLNGTKADPPCG